MKQIILSLGSLGGGIALAVVPAIALITATKLFGTQEQGYLAVAIMFASYIGQTATAGLIEAKLANPHRSGHLRIPSALLFMSAATVIAFVIWPTTWWVIAFGLPIIFAALESGRAAAVAERRDIREIVASIVVGGVSFLSLILAFSGCPQTYAVLAAGVLVASLVRSYRIPRDVSKPQSHFMFWVIADVGITGAIFPLLNTVVISQLGAESAVAFAAISSASGVVGIPLTYLRIRLLSEHSRFDILLSLFSVLTAIFAILIADWLGIFSLLFGNSWNEAASIGALLVACAWRGASMLTTIPFAKFRRAGRAKTVTYIRLISSVVSVLIAVSILRFDNLALVFGAMLTGELLQWAAFEFMSRKKLR